MIATLAFLVTLPFQLALTVAVTLVTEPALFLATFAVLFVTLGVPLLSLLESRHVR